MAMTDEYPEAMDSFPDPETPLSDLVDEEIIAPDEAIDADEADDFVESVETRRRRPDEFIDAGDDAEETPPAPGGAEELPQEMVRQQIGSRWTLLPLAFGLIGTGALLLANNLVDGFDIDTGGALMVLFGALVLTNVFRFFESGRRERGLFFIAVTLLLWMVLLALDNVTNSSFSLADYWPLTIAAIGFGFIITFLFERTHQIGLVFPGILLIFASGIAVMAAQDLLSQPFQEFVVDYMMLIVAFIGLSLIPMAFQER